MARGGARRGAGRKRGSKSPETIAREERAKEVAAQVLAEGVTPLEVMIGAMRQAYEKGGYLMAAAYAKEAAPYVHPKLANLQADVKAQLDHYTAQPIPVEERNPIPPPSDSMAGAAGAAAHSGTAP